MKLVVKVGLKNISFTIILNEPIGIAEGHALPIPWTETKLFTYLELNHFHLISIAYSRRTVQ